MTYSVIIEVTAPVELYDVTHAELLRRTGGQVDGLLVHLCRPVDGGFQVIEVWTTENDYRRATQDLIEPILNELSGPSPGPSRMPRVEEFALRGLVLPGSGIVI